MSFNRMCVALAATAFSAAAMPVMAEDVDEDRFALGREVFLERAEPQCALCHALADAGADGAVGPDLDTMRPSHERVLAAVTQGIGPMMPYDHLNEEEVDALAHYVSRSTGAEE